jgi:hypothetical protein
VRLILSVVLFLWVLHHVILPRAVGTVCASMLDPRVGAVHTLGFKYSRSVDIGIQMPFVHNPVID